MDNRPRESVTLDLDALFRLGVVAGVSDEQLLERFAAQTESDSELAFDAIVRRHGPMVMGVCRRLLGNEHDADDAFQATFIVLALKASAVRKRQSLGPWLHGVAVRICRRARLVRRRHHREPIPAGGLIDYRGDGSALFDLKGVIDEELRQLPDKYRLPVVLCYLEGRTQEEAARELGWTKGTVSGRLARAKEALYRRLIRRGMAPATALVTASLASESASARVCAALLASTVRTATLASYSGLKTGSTTAEVGTLVRLAVRSLLFGRIARITALVLLFGVGAAAIAAQALGPPRPVSRHNAITKALAAGRPKPAPRGPRLDRFGDELPPDVKTRLGTIERRHTARVVGVDFSDLGKRAVTAQADGLIRFWDGESGRQLRTIDVTAATPDGNKSVRQAAVAREGKYLAAAGFVRAEGALRPEDTVWIVSLPEGRPLRTIATKTIDLQSLAFSPDGTTIATGGSAGEVKLWDVATGDCRKTTTLAQNQSVFALSFSADGAILATNQGVGITLWDLQSGDKKLLAMPSIAGFAPHFSDDGRYVATGKLGAESVICDRQSNLQQHTVRGFALGFSPGGRSLLVARADEGAISLINSETGEEQWKAVLGSLLQYGGAAFAADGKSVVVSWDNVVRFFDAQSGREKFESNDGHRGAVSAVSYAPGGNEIVTAGNDGTIREWDALSGRLLRVMNDPGIGHLLAISPEGTYLASTTIRAPGKAPAFRVWDRTNGLLLREFPSNANVSGRRALGLSPDGKRVLFYNHNVGLKLVDIATGQEQPVVQPRFLLKADEVTELNLASSAFAPGGQYLALCTGTMIHVVELASGAELSSFAGSTMTFTPDGSGMAVASDRDTSTGSPGNDSQAHARAVELLEIATGARQRIFVAADRVSALAFSPDRRILAVAAGWRECSIRLYRTADGREIDAFACPATRTHPEALVFAPDMMGLAAALDDTTVVIFNVRNAR